MPDTILEAIEAEIPQEHKDFVQSIIDRFDVPAATKPGMRTRFIRSSKLKPNNRGSPGFKRQYVCLWHWRTKPVVEAAKEGQTNLHSSAALIMFSDQSMRAWTLSWHRGTTLAHIQGTIGTFSLVPQVVEAAGDIPVLVAGGVATGQHIAAALPWALRESGSEPLGYFQWSIRTTCIL